jgi:hypothetical protein
MTPRLLASVRLRLAFVTLLAGVSLVAISGCDPREIMYFLQPFSPTIPPKSEIIFEGKKVVVVCHATGGTMGEYPSLERDLCREVSAIFKKKVKKVVMVDPDKVATWVEAHPKWTDPSDIGIDFEADYVIFLEIEQFQLQAPGDLNVLHGESKVHVVAYEMAYQKNSKDKPLKDQPKEAESKYDDYAETSFPSRGPIPVDSSMSRSKFRTKFLKVVAAEVSWHFVEHGEDDTIQDSRIEK